MDVAEADEKGDNPDEAEGAVDESPVGRYPTDGSGDEGERDDACAGDDAELKDPFVADRVDEWTEEGDGDDDMGKGQPVRAVGHEWVGPVGFDNALVHAAEPGVERGFAGGRG